MEINDKYMGIYFTMIAIIFLTLAGVFWKNYSFLGFIFMLIGVINLIAGLRAFLIVIDTKIKF